MSQQQELLQMAREIDAHLRAVRQVLRQPIDAEIARGRLTGPQVSVIQALVHKNGMSLKDLSSEIGSAHSTVSGIVDRLEKRGLLERQVDSADRRFSKIVVSKAVQEYLQNELPGVLLSPLVQALQRAKPAGRKTILEGLKLLRKHLRQV